MIKNTRNHAAAPLGHRSDYYRKKVASMASRPQTGGGDRDMVSSPVLRGATGWLWVWQEVIDPAISCLALVALAWAMVEMFR